MLVEDHGSPFHVFPSQISALFPIIPFGQYIRVFISLSFFQLPAVINFQACPSLLHAQIILTTCMLTKGASYPHQDKTPCFLGHVRRKGQFEYVITTGWLEGRESGEDQDK